MIPGANWIEREMHEILGITFIGHPEPEKLISEGNWAEGVYPYRKEFYK
jgi:Ni,Fe-hydrogenase III component G